MKPQRRPKNRDMGRVEVGLAQSTFSQKLAMTHKRPPPPCTAFCVPLDQRYHTTCDTGKHLLSGNSIHN
jgi:hypothetical protein